MVIAGESIHKTEEFMAGCGIYDEVNSRQRETIFWACSVDVSEVDVESPLAIFFFNEHDVGQPFWVLHLSDYPCLEEFSDLLIDRFLPFRLKAPSLSLDWLEGWTDVQSVSDYCGVNPSHVLLLPREDILFLSQDRDQS